MNAFLSLFYCGNFYIVVYKSSGIFYLQISIEDEISAEFSMWKDKIRTPCGSPTSIHSTSLSGEDAQLRLIHELIQGNIQRCKYSMEQLVETKQNLFKVKISFE